MAKLVVIDGNSIMNRAFYGLSGKSMLTTKKGIPTNALFGFLNILFKILNEDNPDYLVVAFDLKAPTFRHKMYDGYKAQRKGMPDELATQMPIIKEILDAMNISRVELEGFEADDILGTLAKKAKKLGIDVTLFTGDRDSFQLIEAGICVKLPVTKGGKTETEIYDENKILEKYGVSPFELIDVKGLMGDASDNIPGVPGIGEKTALSFIQKFKTIEKLYENIDDAIVKPKIKEALKEFRDLAFLSRTLATIDTNIPIEFVEDFKVKEVNNVALSSLFNELEFFSFMKKLNLEQDNGKISKFEPVLGEKVYDLSLIDTFDSFAFYTLDEEPYQVGIFSDKGAFCFESQDKYTLYKAIFESDAKKIGAYTKALYIELKGMNIELKNLVFDLNIAEYVTDTLDVSGSMKEVADKRFNIDIDTLKDDNESQISLFETVRLTDNNKFLCSVAKMIWELKDGFIDEIKKNNQEELFYEIEMPLIEVLADMQIAGMKVSRELLKNYGKELQDKIEVLVAEIIDLAGEEFNIKSPKQLGDILFDKLKLPAPKKTHRGYATDADTLERLRDNHPIIDKVLEYKQLVKLKSTYIDGLEAVINKNTGRIHSNFNQTITATGRLSSAEPNLQNIPVRMDAGKKIREMFIPEDGCVFVDADYSQIELRVLAHMAQDKVMLDAFNNDEDIHTTTAMQIFHLSNDEVTSAYRSKAKAVNFGIVYGQGNYSLGQDLRISRKEAEEYINSYFEHFKGIKEFQDNSVKLARENGYVETIFHRRRRLPDIKASNFSVRAFSERIAMNMPIQGSAADIIKIAMNMVYRRLKGMKSRLILQVHDELIIEAPYDEAELAKKIVVECMESAVKLDVLLKVDANIGKSWLEAK